jgi:hypothetical protein
LLDGRVADAKARGGFARGEEFLYHDLRLYANYGDFAKRCQTVFCLRGE